MHGLWSNIFRNDEASEDTRSLLKNTKIFASLSKRELDAIDRIVYKRFYEAGEPVFRQGDPGIGMYIIRQGTISIVQMPAHLILAELQAGDFFGEIALLNETPRSASAIAKTNCDLLSISQPDLLGLFKRNPRLGVKVLIALSQITGQRVIQLDNDLLTLHQQLERQRNNGITTPGTTREDTAEKNFE